MWPFIHHSWSEPLGKVMFRDSVWHKAVSKLGFPDGSVKNLPAVWEIWVWSLDWDDPLEEDMATHSNILAWRIPWTEEPGGLQSMGSQRVRHDWVTKHSTRDTGSIPGSGRSPGGGHGYPFHYSCLENPMDRGTSWATAHVCTTEAT